MTTSSRVLPNDGLAIPEKRSPSKAVLSHFVDFMRDTKHMAERANGLPHGTFLIKPNERKKPGGKLIWLGILLALGAAGAFWIALNLIYNGIALSGRSGGRGLEHFDPIFWSLEGMIVLGIAVALLGFAKRIRGEPVPTLILRPDAGTPRYRKAEHVRYAGMAVRPGQPCPRTGHWEAPRLEEEIQFIEKGDVMPGPAIAPLGDVVWLLLDGVVSMELATPASSS